MIGRRDDGYHELITIFQTVDLADRLTLEVAGAKIDLEVHGGSAPSGEKNLAYRAAQRFLENWPLAAGVRIDLEKTLPIGGGIGGGSSNAATVLMGLRRLTGIPVAVEELEPLARELGADVPYFLYGGTALGRGRGDRIEPLDDLQERQVWLVTPSLEISTPDIFQLHGAQVMAGAEAPAAARWRQAIDWSAIADGRNDLQETVLSRFPVMRDVYNKLVEAGASVVRLSGTGATLFAIFLKGEEPKELAATLPADSRVVRTRTLTRSSLDKRFVVQ